jgi:hypothetical protein
MTNLENRVIHLEQLVNTLVDAVQRLQAGVASLQQSSRTDQQSPYGGSGGGGGFTTFIQPVAIAAGANVTGQTIQTSVSGTLTNTSITNATVYNNMGATTSSTSGKPIVVSPNADGSYSVITQSC